MAIYPHNAAHVKENAVGGTGLTSNMNDLVIRAKSSNTADSHTEAYGGAIVGVNATTPRAIVNPTISAYIDAGAEVNVGGRVELIAMSEADAILTVNGGGGAAVAVDVAEAKAEIISDVDKGQYAMVCVSNDKGEIGWFESKEVRVISVDGKDPREILS